MNNKYKFTLESIGEITISGFSEAGYKTGYLIEPFNIYLDAGVDNTIPANLILLSHGHYDHLNALYSLLINSNKCTVMLDNNLLLFTQNMLNSFSSLNSDKNIIYNNWNPITLPNYNFILSKNQEFYITTFYLNHRVKCRAYGIKMMKNKLKQEYSNHNSNELKELKKTINIIEKKEYPLVLFVSDTNYNGILLLPFNEYKIVIMECTFFDPEHYLEAIERMHLHWDDIKNIIKLYPDITFILGHISSRYKSRMTEINEKVKNECSNVIVI